MTEQQPDEDPFDPASFKAVCAALNIPVDTFTNEAGETDIRIDRPGMERLRDSALLVGELELAEFFNTYLAKTPPDAPQPPERTA